MNSTSILGHSTAEHDRDLQNYFVHTNNYNIIESSIDSQIVVGRRGTGKSAIFLMLKCIWENNKECAFIFTSPQDYDVRGIYSCFESFETLNLIPDTCKTIYTYCILTSVLLETSKHYKTKNEFIKNEFLREIFEKNKKYIDTNIFDMFSEIFEEYYDYSLTPSKNIRIINKKMQPAKYKDEINDLLDSCNLSFKIVIDKLDEGHEPDEIGISTLIGLVNACNDINVSVKSIRPVIFVRDNIWKDVIERDENYSRNTEGNVVRLSWDEDELLSIIAKRITVTKSLDNLSSIEAWNSFASEDLKDSEGFRRCLQHTLYKPRDVLLLLNKAYTISSNFNEDKISLRSIEKAAKDISKTRLLDLEKEYSNVLKNLHDYLHQFNSKQSVIPYSDVYNLLTTFMASTPSMSHKNEAPILIEHLFKIGFLGIYNDKYNKFCHNGENDEHVLNDQTSFIIHPSYWLSLNIQQEKFNDNNHLDNIPDFNPSQSKIIKQQITLSEDKNSLNIISELEKIAPGKEDSKKFEDWCHNILNAIFSEDLENIQKHPNPNGASQRDIVATNNCNQDKCLWTRILNDYRSRQVIFEVKNYIVNSPEEYRQCALYTTDNYGKLVFMITRTDDVNLKKNSTALNQIIEIYKNHRILVVQLPAIFLCDMLREKIKKGQNCEVKNRYRKLSSLLDTYERTYVQIKSR